MSRHMRVQYSPRSGVIAGHLISCPYYDMHTVEHTARLGSQLFTISSAHSVTMMIFEAEKS